MPRVAKFKPNITKHKQVKTLKEISLYLGINKRTLDSWYSAGKFKKGKQGYSTKEVYAIAVGMKDKNETFNNPPLKEKILEAELQKKQWDAKKAELLTKELEGLLVRSEQVEEDNLKKVVILRNSLLAIPSQMAPTLATNSSEKERMLLLKETIEYYINQYANESEIEDV